MTVTQQISASGDSELPIAPLYTGFIGDDWTFGFQFLGTSGVPQNLTAITFSSALITEGPYTSTSISGLNGTVDGSQASIGIIGVTVYDALTSTLTPDVDSVDAFPTTSTSFNTRLALIGASGILTTTYAIIPIRVARR